MQCTQSHNSSMQHLHKVLHFPQFSWSQCTSSHVAVSHGSMWQTLQVRRRPPPSFVIYQTIMDRKTDMKMQIKFTSKFSLIESGQIRVLTNHIFFHFHCCLIAARMNNFIAYMQGQIMYNNLSSFIRLESYIMLGIGHRLEKETKKKILAEKAREYNQKYDQLVAEGKEQEAVQIIDKERYQQRHNQQIDYEPYNNTGGMNRLGGAIDLGYTETHKALTETKTLYKPIEEEMSRRKNQKPDMQKTMQAKDEFERMKKRIHKDHLAEDVEIDFKEPKLSQNQANYREDKLKEEILSQDKRYNQKMNDLKDYAEHYLRSKNSLRKC